MPPVLYRPALLPPSEPFDLFEKEVIIVICVTIPLIIACIASIGLLCFATATGDYHNERREEREELITLEIEAEKDLYLELTNLHAHERDDQRGKIDKKEFEKLVKRQWRKRKWHFRELKEEHEEFESLSTPEQRSSYTVLVDQLKAERAITWDKLEWKDQKDLIERQEKERRAEYQKIKSQVDEEENSSAEDDDEEQERQGRLAKAEARG